jgi:saccharopine dehydrogenase (NADP+, L-glutamate forming)
MLQHKFEIENKDGSRETRTSTLAEYGAPVGSGGYSAMARLVGVPAGVGKSSESHEIPSQAHPT